MDLQEQVYKERFMICLRNNRLWHDILYSFWGKSQTLLCTFVLVDPYGRYYVLPFMSRNHIEYIIPHDQLLLFDHSFFHTFFSSSWVISCANGGLPPSRWIYRSLKLFLLSWCLWPWELQIHVYWSESWIVITCSSEQVSSFFSCRQLYRTFPTIQMHQLHG